MSEEWFEKQMTATWERQARLEKIVTVSHNQIFVFNDADLSFEYANTSAIKSLGYKASEMAGVRLTDLFSYPDEMALQALLNSLRKSQTDRLNLQLRFKRKDGGYYDGDALIQVLEQGRSFLMIVTDITAKLVTEKKLLHTIQEKETLIKEIHHRVKNNLQLISSIVYLKLASVDGEEIRGFLEDTRQKIRSIALIHERLLQTENLDRVEIADYLSKLVHDLKVTYHRPDLTLDIQTELDRDLISLDMAIVCGLIVNELLTNAMKHAFKGLASGIINIHFKKIPEGYQLTVADNGVGLPGHVKPGSSSFGMQLIDVFVKQLNGNLAIQSEKGTKFLITFKS